MIFQPVFYVINLQLFIRKYAEEKEIYMNTLSKNNTNNVTAKHTQPLTATSKRSKILMPKQSKED